MTRSDIFPSNSSAPDLQVRLSHAGVREGQRWRVRDIDLELRDGEIVTLIGPNGSGKSTTVKMLVGALQPHAGSVWRRPGLRIGYVPQKMTVDETLPISVHRLMRISGSPTHASVMNALEKCGADHLLARPVQSLSGGEFQRVSLARALARNPDLLVLDEPTQGVDYTAELELYALIVRLRDETGCSVLMISHDLHVVMAATDRVLCMNGHICCEGSPSSIAAQPEFLKLFDRTGAGLAFYRHDHDHHHSHHHPGNPQQGHADADVKGDGHHHAR